MSIRCLAAAVLTVPVLSLAAAEPQAIEPETVNLGRPVDFAGDVAPAIETNCVACHNAAIDEGRLNLEDVAGMLKGGKRGPAVVPGKPDESLLLAVAAHRREPVMPPPDNDAEAKPLTPRELGLLRQWIIEGAGQGAGAPEKSAIAWRSIPAGLKAVHALDLSPGARFVAVGRANRVEVHDLAANAAPAVLVDPNLAGLIGAGDRPLYPGGASHRDLVHAVAFSPDGNRLASAGYRAVKLWRRVGPGGSIPLGAEGAEVTAIAAAGAESAVVAEARTVRLVRTADGSEVRTWNVPADVAAIAVSADGSRLAVACRDSKLRVWEKDAAEPRTVDLSAEPTAVALVGGRVVTAHADGVLRVWDAATGAAERELKGHAGPVRRVRSVAGRDNVVISAGDDGTARLWDVSSGAELRSIAHGGPVADAAAGGDGKTLATGGADGTVRFWSTDDGKKLAEHRGSNALCEAERAAAGIRDWRKQLAAAAAARVKEAEETLADREGIVKKAQEAKTPAEQKRDEAAKKRDEAAAQAEEARKQAEAQPTDEAAKKKSEEAAKAADAARTEADRAAAEVVSTERSIRIGEEGVVATRATLEARKSEKQKADETVAAAEAAAKTAAEAAANAPAVTAIGADATTFVAGTADGSLQTFALDGRPLETVPPTGQAVADLAVAAGRAVVRGAAGPARRVEVGARWEYEATLGPPADRPLATEESAFADRVLSLAFHPDGRRLATGGGEPSRGGELTIWDVESRSPVRTFEDAHSDAVQAVAFSRDGRVLASASADKFAKTFDPETGAHVRTFEGHTDYVFGVAVRADGTELATVGADASIKVWNLETGEQKKTLAGHAKPVTAVEFVGLADQVVSSGGDKSVRLHRASDGAQVRAYAGAADFQQAVAANEDGSVVVSAGEDGAIYVWNGPDAKLVRKIEPPAPADGVTASR